MDEKKPVDIFGLVKKIIGPDGELAPQEEMDDSADQDKFKYVDSMRGYDQSHLDDDAERTLAASQAAFMVVSSTDQTELEKAGGEAASADPDGYASIFDDLKKETPEEEDANG